MTSSPYRLLLLISSLTVLSMREGPAHANNGAASFSFEVLLDEKVIGTHRYDVTVLPDSSQQIRSRASFEVRLLGVPVFRYQHQADEQWQSECLVSIQSSTRENGKTLSVRGERQTGAFRLSMPVERTGRTDCVTSYAYWNPTRLLAARELLNPQTGEFDPVKVEKLGKEQISWRGAQTSSQRYRLVAPTHRIDLWYSESGEWLQLSSTARGNKQVFYRRVD